MRLRLPYPPSANRLWRVVGGHQVKSAEARRYAQAAALAALAHGARPFTGEVVVFIEVYRPRRSGDLDNRQKAVLDALRGVAFVDDAQVVEIHAYRRDDKADPRVVVTVEEVQCSASKEKKP